MKQVFPSLRPAWLLLRADGQNRHLAGPQEQRLLPGERPAVPPDAAPARRRAGVTIAASVLAFVAAAGSGPLAFALTPPFAATRQIAVTLVQPGVVDDAVQRTDASETLTTRLSHDGTINQAHPDLIVWGESSIPDDLTGSSSADQALLRRIEALSKQDGAEILVNQDTTPPGKGHEKWSVLVNPSGVQGTYVKTRLVPFGEYIPFREELNWLTSISKAASSNMTPGTGAHTLTVTSPTGTTPPVDVGVLICFESAFPDMSRVETDQGAELIVYQSSTSTFQGTWGPDQHASLAAIRAAETGRPAVQAALTGDTVAFDARGRQLAWLSQDDRGEVTVTVSLPAQAAKTFYDQAGDYVMWSGVGITAFAALIMLLRRRHFLANNTGAAGGRTAEYDADTGDPVRSSCARGPPTLDEVAGEGEPRLTPGRHRCRFTAFCRSIRRPRRCARTSSGQWRGPLELLSACPGSVSQLPQGLFVLS